MRALKTTYVKNIGHGKVEKRNKLIEEYYNGLQPDMTYKEFETICKTPFKHMKDNLSSGNLYEIRFRYLGKFTPSPSSVVWMLGYTKDRYDKELIGQSEYNRTITTLTKYVSKNPAPFKNFKKALTPWIKI